MNIMSKLVITPAQRRSKNRVKKKRWRDHYYSQGLRRLELWAHPEDFGALKEINASKLTARGITVDRDPTAPTAV